VGFAGCVPAGGEILLRVLDKTTDGGYYYGHSIFAFGSSDGVRVRRATEDEWVDSCSFTFDDDGITMSGCVPRLFPPHAALIVIDLQKAIDHPSWGERNNPSAEKNVASLLQAWRISMGSIVR
jgi:hypothetical protein